MPLQLVLPVGHPAPHWLALHRPSFGHTVPHPPQLAELLVRSTQAPSHLVCPAVQRPALVSGTQRFCTQA